MVPAQAAPAGGGDHSGLPFDSGVFAQNSATRAASFASERGAPLDVVSVFVDVSSKEAASKRWWTHTVPPGFKGTLSIGVPLWTKDSNVAAAARGEMDSVYRSIAGGLKDAGYQDAYVRLAWEMNIHGHSASGSATPENAAQWVEAFRRASDIFNSVSSDFRIVFNPNAGPSQTGIEADKVYPGDRYVDVIGIDAYDWWPAYTSDEAWRTHLYGPYGWDHWMKFARQHGKKFALPEWGLSRANAHAGGDNPRYIGYVYSYLRDNSDAVAFEAYYDESAAFCQCSLTQNPASRGTYGWWMGSMR